MPAVEIEQIQQEPTIISFSPNHLDRVQALLPGTSPDLMGTDTLAYLCDNALDSNGQEQFLHLLEMEVNQQGLGEVAYVLEAADIPTGPDDVAMFEGLKAKRDAVVDFILRLIDQGSSLLNSPAIERIMARLRTEFDYLLPQTQQRLQPFMQ